MKKIIYMILLISLISFTVYSKEETSESVYKEEIKEFNRLLDKINKDIKKEEKQINFLKTSLINNDISSAKLEVKLINKDDSYFKIISADIMMNGTEIFTKKNISKKEMIIFNKASDPGMYTFHFKLVVTGAGYGFFTYMKSYKFTINRTIKVEVPNIGKSKIRFTVYKNKKGDNSKNPASMLGIKVKVQ